MSIEETTARLQFKLQSDPELLETDGKELLRAFIDIDWLSLEGVDGELEDAEEFVNSLTTDEAITFLVSYLRDIADDLLIAQAINSVTY